MNLLEKTRKLNEVLQAYDNVQVVDLANVLSAVEGGNVYCANAKGMILGYKQLPKCIDEERLVSVGDDKFFPEVYTRYLQNVIETKVVEEEKAEGDESVKSTIIVPVYTENRRLGSMVVELNRKDVKNDDIILAEFAATALGAAILREDAAYNEQVRNCNIAVNNLSFSEKRAIRSIFAEMEGNECYLVASKIADAVGITRSVIVNALRKLEGAGVIETRSLGMKGTYIRIKASMLNEVLENAGF